MYQIQAIDIERVYANNFIVQKIRSLDAIAKLLEKIFEMLKKNFVHLGLKKKKSKKLRTSPKKYVKAISFTICS